MTIDVYYILWVKFFEVIPRNSVMGNMLHCLYRVEQQGGKKGEKI